MKTIDYNSSITRVYTFERFLQILVDSSLSFVSPNLWEDPWEAIIFKNENSKWSDKLEITLWGSCWTLNTESDFAWKAYSPNKNGIMVESTIAKIQAAIESNCKHSRLVHGKVDYSENYMIRTKGRFYVNQEKLPREEFIQKGLFTKRHFFTLENEYRFFIMNNTQSRVRSISREVPIDPNAVFDKIILDPRISDFHLFKKIITQLGFKNKVMRSELLKKPTLPSF